MIVEKIKEDILVDVSDDYCGLCFALGMATEHMEGDHLAIKPYMLEAVLQLLSEGKIFAGFPTEDGGFRAWRGTLSAIMGKIDRDWIALGEAPNLYDVVWFSRPDCVEEWEEID